MYAYFKKSFRSGYPRMKYKNVIKWPYYIYEMYEITLYMKGLEEKGADLSTLKMSGVYKIKIKETT